MTHNCVVSFDTIGIWPETIDGTDLTVGCKSSTSSYFASGDDFEGDLRPKTTIAYVAGYRNYDEPESKQIATWLKIKKNITEALRSYEDGYVTVKLVIKEECINP